MSLQQKAKQTLRGKKTFLIEALSADAMFVLQHAQEKEIIIDREYENLNHPNHTREAIITNLLDKVMNKGEETCLKFVQLLQDKPLQKNFPKLKEHFTAALPALDQDHPVPVDEMMEYKMSSDPRGLCVIINNIHFEKRSEEDKTRYGSDSDEESLRKVFRWLGFTVEAHSDQTAQQMKHLLKQLSQKQHEGDCFVCCILSHGCDEGVYGTDWGVVSREDIFGPFRATTFSSLAGKPKVFFIQACRGEDYQLPVEVQADNLGAEEDKDDEAKEYEMDAVQITIPPDGDFLVARSTVKGFFSIRDTQSGSLFIQSLCNQLKKHCPKCEDIQSILVCVNQEVGRKVPRVRVKHQYVTAKQMPVHKVTLRKKLVFRVPSCSGPVPDLL